MKAILAVLIVLGTTNVFAQSAEIRAEFQNAQRLKAWSEHKQFCAKNAEYCQVQEDITRLTEARAKVATVYNNAVNAPRNLCTAIHNSERSAIDGQGIKFVSYTDCSTSDAIRKSQEQSRMAAARAANQLKAIDAVLAEKNALSNSLKDDLKK